MPQKYLIHNEQQPTQIGDRVIIKGQSLFLTIDGKRIYFFKNYETGYRPLEVVVPGVAVSEVYEVGHGQKAVDIEPIRDPELRKTLTDKLSKDCPINFWSD